MLVPAVVYYIIFCYAPMYGVTIAFKDFNPDEGDHEKYLGWI